MRNVSVLTLFLMLTALTPGAWADSETEIARRLYESATRHFDLTEYDAALNDFKEGYRHKDDPVFLYNIAQCYRLLNQNDDALKFYRSYLRRAPNAPNRDEVEHRIATLQESIAIAEKARTTPPQTTLPPAGSGPKTEPPAAPASTAASPAPSPTSQKEAPAAAAPTNVVVAAAPPARTPVYKKWWLWTAVGVVVAAGVGVGLGLGLSSHGTNTRVLPPIGGTP